MKHIYRKIYLILAMLSCLILMTACGRSEDRTESSRDSAVSEAETENSSDLPESLKKTGSMELYYAEEFSVDYYEGGYSLITIGGTDRYLTVPEGEEAPEGLDEDICLLQLPLDSVYLAASSAMDLVRQLGALDCIAFTGTEASDWSIPEIQELVENGTILYGGKYNMPDYELLSLNECDIAIESTMINHAPEVKEQLERLGIPVMTERSSYESEPLGRAEWIRLYGLLTGKETEADSFMDECKARLEKITSQNHDENERPEVVYFYITASGSVSVRAPGDYITKMIDMAGGHYILEDADLDETGNSTVTMDMESFYAYAKDADILIYNGTLGEQMDTMDQLLDKSELLKDFKAVQEDNCWCCGKNSFQATTGIIGMIEDFNNLVNGGQGEMNYLTRIN